MCRGFLYLNCYFVAFVEAGKSNKAMVAYEKALQWQELFELALQESTPQEDLVTMGYRVAGRFPCDEHRNDLIMIWRTEDLFSKKRYAEAARVLLDYSKDTREAVIALVSGNAFSEARRVVRQFFFMFSQLFKESTDRSDLIRCRN